MHVLQIIDDHQALWYAADDDEARACVEQRLRRQLGLASLNWLGWEMATGGVLHSIAASPAVGGSVLLVGLMVWYLTLRRL